MNNSIDFYIDQLINHTDVFNANINDFEAGKVFDFSEETILITGAAGTIGKELFQQLIPCTFKKVILIDIAESALYNLSIEFTEHINHKIELRVCNINDKASIKHIFSTYNPTMVFHCAAYKHVPLMEINPYEAVKTNIIATKLLADLSAQRDVKKFVFVSSDKAVAPISIMGITKHIAEQYLDSLESNTEFIITRFGNILGSNGSVLPVFLKQIELNLSLTITDKDMTRYFIGQQKACQLILESTILNKLKNKTLSFKNNSPISIYKLAKSVISISKKDDIIIKVTGVRSGEKLHEIMVDTNESTEPTSHPDIFQIKNKKKPAKQIADFKYLKKITPNTSTLDAEIILRKYL
ncbi:polysaccharide biosynthesis protein [Aestuariibaculum sp. YM273]|uniref:polysaccharide biosynthesis protein n=1 Tax=Aestuariibaculum sp. YM273 TaxID=3070659 RepID=UPI0027DD5BEF|nr:polysaccharide biosynthesis protein [Aestuariibaculum sp. YM273]WMI65141.1 polysaccharide biosynthesis protein [Aestuariibaculum sp. YM273]